MAILHIPQTIRSVQRVYQIARVLSAHGFDDLVQRLNLTRYVPFGRRLGMYRPRPQPEPTERARDIGRRLAAVAQDLGPTFVKLGQLLSTRPDLIPAEVVEELSRLQDSVAPFPTAQAREIVSASLGGPVEHFFPDFPEQPLASGSIAQTYVTHTTSERQVVVKVRRPNIDSVIRSDMHILKGLAHAAENLMPELRTFRPRQFIDELSRSLEQELDFVHEASATTQFHDAFAESERRIAVPQVLWDLTGDRVLTIEFLEGQSFRESIARIESVAERSRIARELTLAFMDQYFHMGMFHADPHPGNLLLLPDGRIGLIDFGMIGRLDDSLRVQFVMALIASVRKDVEMVVDVLSEIQAITPETDEPALRRDLQDLLEKYHGLPLRRFEMQTVFAEVTTVVREHHVHLPRDFVLFGKSLVTVASIALQLDPNLDLVELARPQLRSLVTEQLSPDRWLRLGGRSLWHGVHILRDAPKLLRDILRRAERGQMSIQVRHEHFDDLISEMDRSSNRLAFSLVVAAIIVGSSLILHAKIGPMIGEDLSVLGLMGYAVAGVMGIWLLVAILRSNKLS